MSAAQGRGKPAGSALDIVFHRISLDEATMPRIDTLRYLCSSKKYAMLRKVQSVVSSERREAFFGLIAPIGIDLTAVELALEQAFRSVDYDINKVKLTTIFEELNDVYDVSYNSEYERYEKFISAGDKLCKESGRNDILALYGIEKLKLFSPRDSEDMLPTSVCHVFRQIKRTEEIETLRNVYGRNILFLACYSSKHDRKQNLVKKLLKTNRGASKTSLESMALQIIAIDEDEKDVPSGQRVLECYPHADFVIDCSNNQTLLSSVDGLVKIYFGHPFISPTKDEYCSYFANAASYRSLDLSRQVGAAIFSDSGEVVALGCNEVPKAGGGTYWDDSVCDQRDYAVGHDSNQQVKQDMARDALVRLQENWLVDKYRKLSPERLSLQALDLPGAPLKRAMLADVIEYGRMVHAEMNAITDAARSRKSTQDCTLYCTTMPCHLCTKLVIASGIKRVVYLQPYPKSLVDELYTDSVSIDKADEPNKVSFETLKGVTPNGFRMAFRKTGKRKNSDGSAVIWNPIRSIPIFLSHVPYYRSLEINASSDLAVALDKALSGTKAQLKLQLDKSIEHNGE